MKATLFTATYLLATTAGGANAFTLHSIPGTSMQNGVSPSSSSSSSSSSLLKSVNDNNDNSCDVAPSERRAFLRNVAGMALGSGVGVLMNQQPAAASYSAFTNREKDWQDRQSTGDIQYSSARDLKKALREVAPMNASKSQIFCPNGTSSAVSPLMENKCNDIEAMPSVFGRSDDLMGNSIPGRNLGGTTSLTADTGGFPSYGSKR